MLLAIATFTVVWLVASPASALPARAPVCDPRGAIGFAPPPQIQDAEQSLDIPADCYDVSPLETRNIVPGRGHRVLDFSSSQEPVAATAPIVPVLAFAERLAVRVVIEARPPPGVRSSLDRPPRI
jgi:hypothetical protein